MSSAYISIRSSDEGIKRSSYIDNEIITRFKKTIGTKKKTATRKPTKKTHRRQDLPLKLLELEGAKKGDKIINNETRHN